MELQLPQLRWPADGVDSRESTDAMLDSSQRGRRAMVSSQRESRPSRANIFVPRFAAEEGRQTYADRSGSAF